MRPLPPPAPPHSLPPPVGRLVLDLPAPPACPPTHLPACPPACSAPHPLLASHPLQVAARQVLDLRRLQHPGRKASGVMGGSAAARRLGGAGQGARALCAVGSRAARVGAGTGYPLCRSPAPLQSNPIQPSQVSDSDYEDAKGESWHAGWHVSCTAHPPAPPLPHRHASETPQLRFGLLAPIATPPPSLRAPPDTLTAADAFTIHYDSVLNGTVVTFRSTYGNAAGGWAARVHSRSPLKAWSGSALARCRRGAPLMPHSRHSALPALRPACPCRLVQRGQAGAGGAEDWEQVLQDAPRCGKCLAALAGWGSRCTGEWWRAPAGGHRAGTVGCCAAVLGMSPPPGTLPTLPGFSSSYYNLFGDGHNLAIKPALMQRLTRAYAANKPLSPFLYFVGAAGQADTRLPGGAGRGRPGRRRLARGRGQGRPALRPICRPLSPPAFRPAGRALAWRGHGHHCCCRRGD